MNLRLVRRIVPALLLFGGVAAAVVYLITVSNEEPRGLQASGTVEAVEIVIASEVGGRIRRVLVGEGDPVEQGDPLLELEDDLLQAQLERARKAVEAARKNVDLAKVNLRTAQIQRDIALQGARAAEAVERRGAWLLGSPVEFEQPVWYFQQAEQIQALEAELEKAQSALEDERNTLRGLVGDALAEDLEEADKRLAQARSSFLIAEALRDQARRAQDDEGLEDYAETLYDAAREELEAAQSQYEQLLSEETTSEVLEARARIAVDQERVDRVHDQLNALRTGEFSLQLQASQIAVRQAEAAFEAAQAQQSQARAELALIELQLEKSIIYSPASGTVFLRSVEPGEVLNPGSTALLLAKLNQLTITVFIPEDRYGQIQIGQEARVTVDSFPGMAFTAEVIRIADEAEFTPRNVQTEEGRRTTVFAVKLALQDPGQRLKPGMPADVDFGE